MTLLIMATTLAPLAHALRSDQFVEVSSAPRNTFHTEHQLAYKLIWKQICKQSEFSVRRLKFADLSSQVVGTERNCLKLQLHFLSATGLTPLQCF